MQAETYPHIASEQFELLQQLSQLIESVRIIDNEPLWTAADVAEYLRVGEASVLKNFCYMPGFPAGFRLPSRRGLGSRRWRPADIRHWCDRQSVK